MKPETKISILCTLSPTKSDQVYTDKALNFLHSCNLIEDFNHKNVLEDLKNALQEVCFQNNPFLLFFF